MVADVVDESVAGEELPRPDRRQQDFIGFDEDLSIRRELDRFFREQGIEMRMAMQFDNIQMIKEAVALGSGISILPARTMLAEVEQGRLVAKNVEGVVIRGSGHWLMDEAPDQVIPKLVEFLGSRSSK